MTRFWQSLTGLGRMVLAGLLIAALVLGLFGLRSCQQAQVARTETRLWKNQTGAALASGADAVAAVGGQQAAEVRIDIITEENDRAIRQAPGADAPLDPALDAAARRGLCRRAAYRGRTECLQFAPAR